MWEEELHRGKKMKSLLFRVLETLCLKHSCWVIAQTNSNREVVKDYNPNALFVGNGVFLDEFTKSPATNIFEKYKIQKSKPWIGFIGNWENWMRIEN